MSNALQELLVTVQGAVALAAEDRADEQDAWERDVEWQLVQVGMSAVILLDAWQGGPGAPAVDARLRILLEDAEALNELWYGARAQRLGQA